MQKKTSLLTTLYEALVLPFKSIKARYIPLLLVYFAYGASSFAGISETFWIKNELNLGAAALLALSIWTLVPWTIKMVFGQMVDSITLFGSNRKIYVYIGAVFTTVSTVLLIGVSSDAKYLSAYSKESMFIFSTIVGVVGFVLQDVVADTMSTEVIDTTASEEDRNKELATIQVLGRLSVGLALIAVAGIGGWMAEYYSFTEILQFSLVIPIISILGVTFVRLNDVASTPLNKRIFFGGILFAVFIVLVGYNDVPYSQEIVFVVSLVIVLVMLREVIHDVAPDVMRKIYMSMVIIFFYQLSPDIGDGLQWWQIDVLGFNEAFFGTLRQTGAILGFIGLWFATRFIVNQSIAKVLIVLSILGFLFELPVIGLYYNVHELLGLDARSVAFLDKAAMSPFKYIATVLMLTLIAIYAPEGKKATWFALMASFMNIAANGGRLLGKYLNEIFVVTREVKVNGTVTVAQDYSELGVLLWVVSIMTLIIPIVVIVIFDPKEKHKAS